jgi:hypothetical protein
MISADVYTHDFSNSKCTTRQPIAGNGRDPYRARVSVIPPWRSLASGRVRRGAVSSTETCGEKRKSETNLLDDDGSPKTQLRSLPA